MPHAVTGAGVRKKNRFLLPRNMKSLISAGNTPPARDPLLIWGW